MLAALKPILAVEAIDVTQRDPSGQLDNVSTSA